MKSLIAFLQVLLHEMGEWCHASTSIDGKTINARFEHEGLSFITITLPNFGKDFEKSLDQGFVDRNQFQGFAFTGGLPRFLGGFLDLVFDRSTGRLLDIPSVDAIKAIHQLTLMFAKIALPCSDARDKAAINKYVECEQDVRRADSELSEVSKDRFSRLAVLLWADVFSSVDLTVYQGDIIPKHGPGSTADKLKGNLKFNQQEWTRRLEAVFPHGENLASSWSHFGELDRVNILEPGAERPVRVITVPKTLKTPRIIAIEPTCMQYMQQGILEAIVDAICANDTAHSLIGFDDQIPNRVLAQKGSSSGAFATLDMSEASDRVSNQHVRLLLRHFPSLAEGVDATRSRKADVPDHGVIRLAKFASMGSALCFPFEAIVFCTVVFMGIEKALNRQLTRKDIKSLVGRVRVYGDDIIVPVEYAEYVVDELTAFGLKVNVNKSFWTGRFRESCGGDFYDGHDITIVRCRSVFPTRRKQAAEIVSTISLRNHLFEAGFVDSVAHLDELIMRILPHYPVVEATSRALGRLSYEPYVADKISQDLQIPLVKAFVVHTVLPKSKLDNYGALMKYFLKRGDLPFADEKHLLRAGRPVSVDIKTRWTSPF